MLKFLYVVGLFFFITPTFGQLKNFPRPKVDDKEVTKNYASDSMLHFKVIGKYCSEGIKLRWAPTTEEYWRKYNSGGYVVQRFSYDTLGYMDKNLVQIGDTIRPWPFEKFKEFLTKIKNEPYVGAVAQNIYGKTPAEKFQAWTDYTDDLQNRYAFTLLAAEYSSNAALSAGLSFLDKEVKKNRFYHYRIIGVADQLTSFDTVDVYLNTFELEELLTPAIENPMMEDGFVGFSWNREVHKQFYSGYFIERSEDGKSFSVLNQTPYVNAISDNLPQDATWIKWNDKSIVNYKKYHYRIKGITPFGETGPPSNILVLSAIDKTPPTAPTKINAEYLGGKKVKISWTYDGKEGDLAGFMIGRSRKANESFENISGDKPINKKERFFIDTSCVETTTNFYIVAAVDTAKNAAASLVSYAAILDSIPPSKPLGLKGSIDTNGIVTLHWPLGKEIDIKGYFVWSANASNHQLINLTPKAIQDTIWRDTIPLKTLTKEIFYVIQAVDRMSNSSAYSDRVLLMKPDIVPPVAPVIIDYKNEVGKVVLSWQKSTSPDVAYHQVLRKTNNDLDWKVIAKKKLNETSNFVDVNVKENAGFQYSITAVDSSGNVSNKAHPLAIKSMRDLTNPLKDFSVERDTSKKMVTLKWTDLAGDDYREIIIYRAVNKGPVKSLIRIKRNEGGVIHVYEDKNLKNTDSFEYACKVVYDKGLTSNFSALIEAKMAKAKKK